MASSKITVWIGTKKGAFALTSGNRKSWTMAGPHFPGWDVNHLVQDPRDPKRFYAAVNSAWFGPHIHASTNGGKTWKLSEKGLELKSVPNESLKRVWNICPGAAYEPGVVYAGGDPGALFRSGDWGKSWEEVTSLINHPTRSKWTPGAGGMCLHSIQCLGNGRMVVAISAAARFELSMAAPHGRPSTRMCAPIFNPTNSPKSANACTSCWLTPTIRIRYISRIIAASIAPS